ncbi:hypothetical protein F4821DRAFT_175851 [Hypoxylon rubiginosum]|uniref:Uncharacterized protein n=1 Tax=Hypoxylon rubiginosum TaxID=110542 RepID=A0ACC0CV46_9PEZI|nr:hypothetical protein F4821DRAFT_175851 [Hypoxylon rubiginosum]
MLRPVRLRAVERGLAQFSVGVVAASLSLIYFRSDLKMFLPAVASFVLLLVCMVFLAFRGNRVRTYHWVGLFELVILGLWAPPIYAVAENMAARSVERRAALVFYCINVIFRLLNFIGNIILTHEYNTTKHYAP